MSVSVSYRDLCEHLWDSGARKPNISCILRYVASLSPIQLDENQLKSLQRQLNIRFFGHFKNRWVKAHRMKPVFLKDNTIWLENSFSFKIGQSHLKNQEDNKPGPSNVAPGNNKGRPKSSFDKSSAPTKYRKIKDIASAFSKEELLFALRRKIAEEAKDPVLKETKLNKALALYMDLGLTKEKYRKLKKYNEEYISYPAYEEICEAKKQCLPSSIEVNERGARIDLQSLLDHTALRILRVITDEVIIKNGEKIILRAKWGMDGSSGHSCYKQNFMDDAFEDSSVFIIFFSPLSLIRENGTCIWENPRPSSTRYCRPVSFQYKKETFETLRSELQFYQRVISELKAANITFSPKRFAKVSYELSCTMVDGKAISAFMEQRSSSSCNVCGIKPSLINDLEVVKSLPCKPEALEFVISPLHCLIRFLECVLHISYNLDFKHFEARSEEHKKLKEAKKAYVQQELKSKLGLRVDMVKQGFGTTSDGNTARKFFSETSTVSLITGIDEGFLEKLATILQVILSGREIVIPEFEKFCFHTAEEYIRLYGWYRMPPSLHKVLIHGGKIIGTAPLAIGKMSEEALEASNKIFKEARKSFSRKMSRVETNQDLINYLLIASDPLISSIRKVKNKKSIPLNAEALRLLEGAYIADSSDEE